MERDKTKASAMTMGKWDRNFTEDLLDDPLKYLSARAGRSGVVLRADDAGFPCFIGLGPHANHGGENEDGNRQPCIRDGGDDQRSSNRFEGAEQTDGPIDGADNG